MRVTCLIAAAHEGQVDLPPDEPDYSRTSQMSINHSSSAQII
jgi:hypothetical protein